MPTPKAGEEEHSLKNVEIFKVGRWNGMFFDAQALDDMVKAFDELNDVHKVPLKFGHRKDEQIPKGQPAIGWVTGLKRVDKSLLADFSNVPTLVRRAFEKKLYRTVSIEMLMGARLGERMFKHVLDAVALLGADQPAVHGLGDLDQFLAERSVAFDDAGRRVAFETIAGGLKHKPREVTMDEETKAAFGRIEALLTKAFGRGDDHDDAVRKEVRALKDKIDEQDRTIAKLTADKADFERKEKDREVTQKRVAAKDLLESAVKARQITPAQRESFTKQYGLDDDDLVRRLDLEVFKKTFEIKVQERQQFSSAHSVESPDGTERPDTELDRLTKEQMAETNSTDYAKSFALVAQANPDLHRAYLNMNR